MIFAQDDIATGDFMKSFIVDTLGIYEFDYTERILGGNLTMAMYIFNTGEVAIGVIPTDYWLSNTRSIHERYLSVVEISSISAGYAPGKVFYEAIPS